jgi:hypothetical protein
VERRVVTDLDQNGFAFSTKSSGISAISHQHVCKAAHPRLVFLSKIVIHQHSQTRIGVRLSVASQRAPTDTATARCARSPARDRPPVRRIRRAAAGRESAVCKRLAAQLKPIG